MHDKRFEIQKEAAKKIVFNFFRILINLAPRIGKTLIGINAVRDWMVLGNGKRVLWIAPSTAMRDKDVPEEFEKFKMGHLLDNVDIICYQSLASTDLSSYGLVIADEGHMFTPANAVNLVKTDIPVTILTGTPPTDEDKVKIIAKLGITATYKISIVDAVNMKLISPFKINIIYYELNSVDRDVRVGKEGSKFFTTERDDYNFITKRINKDKMEGKKIDYTRYLYRQRRVHSYPSRIDLAKKILRKIKPNSRTLIFAPSIKISEELCENTYNSKTDKSAYDAFQNEEINKLALVEMAGLGTTFNNMSSSLIMATNSKSTKFIQKLCRNLVFRPNYESQIYVICAKGTKDEDWVNASIQQFDESVINRVDSRHVKWK